MQDFIVYMEQAAKAAAWLRQAGLVPADIVIQCGSGLSPLTHTLLDGIEGWLGVPMSDVPQLPQSAVAGHGREIIGAWIKGVRVLIVTGRVHLYEGHPAERCGFISAVAQASGAKLFILTNAAGGLNQHFRTGELMLHNDMINFQGEYAVAGLRTDDPAQRFIDPKPPYDLARSAQLGAALQQAGLTVHQGVYIGVRGPMYETRAELAMFRSFGADAIGMSSIPEISVCNLLKLPVCGLSLITNECFAPDPVSHEEVMSESRNAAARLGRALRRFVENWPA
ncbi:purine-nucleoside phosphorylase [bacterium]|nr:purine-nucleoside phosphorylase [bacterium]